MFGLNPFSLMRQITEEMDQAFRGTSEGRHAGVWAPALDIQHCNGTLVVSAELPGLKKDEVNVEVADDTLILSGERKREHQEDHEGYHRFERSYGQFYRAIYLPPGANADQIRAEMKDGLLRVSIPIPEPESRSRKIQIDEGSPATKPSAKA